jgi:hypothetical protein
MAGGPVPVAAEAAMMSESAVCFGPDQQEVARSLVSGYLDGVQFGRVQIHRDVVDEPDPATDGMSLRQVPTGHERITIDVYRPRRGPESAPPFIDAGDLRPPSPTEGTTP